MRVRFGHDPFFGASRPRVSGVRSEAEAPLWVPSRGTRCTGAVLLCAAILCDQLFHVELAQPRNLLGGAQRAQRLDRRQDDVDRIGATERLGEDVMDPGKFENGAHRAAGDDAGPRSSGLEQHVTGPDLLDDFMGIVRPTIGTVIRLFLAASTPLRIASGTSPAFPIAKPTRPFRSPTTTSALKLKRFPPLTTLATRLTRTTASSRLPPSRSRPPLYCMLTPPRSGLRAPRAERGGLRPRLPQHTHQNSNPASRAACASAATRP